jgi:hypothetical protein
MISREMSLSGHLWGISFQCKAYQAYGELVEVIEGQLRGIYGVISEEAKNTLLIHIHTLQTSVAVEIDRGELVYFADNTKEC